MIQLRGEPVFIYSTRAIVALFVKQNVMIDNIKSFLEVYEDSTRDSYLIVLTLQCLALHIESRAFTKAILGEIQ